MFRCAESIGSLLKYILKYLQTHSPNPHPPALPKRRCFHLKAKHRKTPGRDEQGLQVKVFPATGLQRTHRKGFVYNPICSNNNSLVIAPLPPPLPWLGHNTVQNANLQILGTDIQTNVARCPLCKFHGWELRTRTRDAMWA